MYTVSMLFLYTVGFQWHTMRLSSQLDRLEIGWWRHFHKWDGDVSISLNFKITALMFKNIYLSYTPGNSNNGKWKNIVCCWMTSTWSVFSIVIEVRKMLPTCTVTLRSDSHRPLFLKQFQRSPQSFVQGGSHSGSIKGLYSNNDMLDHFCPSFNVW